MDDIVFKVGELAQRTGLTVRTLHHYHDLGLLVPSRRTAAGHRLYTYPDLERLQRILSLRQLGFSLEEIGGCLDGTDFSLLQVLELHVARLRERLEHEHRLLQRLESVARTLRVAGELSADDLIRSIEVTTMFEKYYTPEQLEQLKAREEALGPEGMEKAQNDWGQLMAEVQGAMDRGADPGSEEVQALAQRWETLVEAFTGGDPGIAASLGRFYSEAPDAAEAMGGPGGDMRQFMAAAAKAQEH